MGAIEQAAIKLNALQAQIATNTNEIASLKTRATNIESGMTTLTQRVTSAQNTLNALIPTVTLISGDDYLLHGI